VGRVAGETEEVGRRQKTECRRQNTGGCHGRQRNPLATAYRLLPSVFCFQQ
jgi:hypothetical protein